MPKAQHRDTREEILKLARDITQTSSFNWLSYQDLCERLEIRKASVHYHFPTKQELGLELLRSYREMFAKWSEKVLARELSPTDRLDAYFEMYKKILGKSERVCPGGVFSLEWNTLSGEMRDELKGLFADHRRWLGDVLSSGRKSGEFKEHGPIEDQVAMIGACIQGALQVSRVMGNPGALNTSIRQLRLLIVK